jgi:hypothetical protein
VSRLRDLVVACALVACAVVACTKTEAPRGAGAKTVAATDADADAQARADADAKADADADAGADADAQADAGTGTGTGTGTGAGADVEGDTNTAPPPFLARPDRAKSVGHTSVVYKVVLASGVKAAFRPAFRKGPIRYKGEIAAFRLGRALGIPNVLRAYPRTVRAGDLAAALGRPLPAEVIQSGDDVKGAIVPWIDALDFLPIEKEPLASRWRAWMKQGASIDAPAEARQIATMVVFDWITGNWDRWSGGNVGWAADTSTVLFIDNDGAFFATPPKEALARQWKMLEAMDRFPRALVRRLRTFDRAALAAAIGDESPGVPLLSDKALDGVDERRRALVALVDAKIGDAGDAEALYFP